MSNALRIKMSEFENDPKAHLTEVSRSRELRVITVNGRDSVVVQDARSYRALLEALERAETVAGIRSGLKSIEDGTSIPFSEFEADLRRELKLPRRK